MFTDCKRAHKRTSTNMHIVTYSPRPKQSSLGLHGQEHASVWHRATTHVAGQLLHALTSLLGLVESDFPGEHMHPSSASQSAQSICLLI